MQLKTAREKAKLTQNQVASAIGVNQSAVAIWETGRAKPRADKLPALAKLLGCTIDELLETEVRK